MRSKKRLPYSKERTVQQGLPFSFVSKFVCNNHRYIKNNRLSKSSILAAMSAARQQVGQPSGVPGRMRRASVLTVLDERRGGPGQFCQILQTARSFLMSYFTRKVRQAF